eukprot:765269-Hanusia_phi.AAC.6
MIASWLPVRPSEILAVRMTVPEGASGTARYVCKRQRLMLELVQGVLLILEDLVLYPNRVP